MTQVINGTKVYDYEEWVKKPDIAILAEDKEECEACGGEGTHTCVCGDEHDCHECGGKGEYGPDLKGMYAAQLKDELQKLLTWRETVLSGGKN